MKKLMIPVLLFAACNPANHNGRYVNHTEVPYAITDDMLEVRDSVITEHTGFQRIRNRAVQPKEFKTKEFLGLRPQFNGNQLILNNTTYEKL